jgi:hypothetical protein
MMMNSPLVGASRDYKNKYRPTITTTMPRKQNKQTSRRRQTRPNKQKKPQKTNAAAYLKIIDKQERLIDRMVSKPGPRKRTQMSSLGMKMTSTPSDPNTNNKRWLELLANPMAVSCTGIIPPFGSYTGAWWVTRKVDFEIQVSLPTTGLLGVAVCLNTFCPLQFSYYTSNTIQFGSTPGDGTTNTDSSAYYANSVGNLGDYQTFYDNWYNQTGITYAISAGTSTNNYTPTYADANPLPNAIPLIGYIEAENCTASTAVGGRMYSDQITPQVTNAGAGYNDTAISFQYKIPTTLLAKAKQKVSATTGQKVCSTVFCDETVASNSCPVGINASWNGSARGAAYIVLANSTAATQSYVLRGAYIYMIEPLSTSGLFDLAQKPPLSNDPMLAMSQTVASLANVQTHGAATDAMNGAKNLLGDAASGNYLKGAKDLANTGASLFKDFFGK